MDELWSDDGRAVAALVQWPRMPRRFIALLVLVVSGLIAMPQQGLGQASTQAWLSPGNVLRQGQSIASDSGQFVLWMQDDGNLVLYGPEGPLFATDTVGRGCQLEMQYDGNAVVYDRAHKPVWSSSTQGNEGAALVVQDDGNLVIYAADLATPLWASGTNVNPPPAQPTARPGWMLPGDVLHANQSLASESGEFVLWMQDDGNLVLYGPEGPVFATGTNGRGVQVEMQYDGNVVVYDANHQPVWATGTQGNEGAVMVAQDDGNLVVYAADLSTPLWASRDHADAPSPPGPPGTPGEGGSDALECVVDDVQFLELGPVEATVRTNGMSSAPLFESPQFPVSCAPLTQISVADGTVVQVIAISDTYAQLASPYSGWILRSSLEGGGASACNGEIPPTTEASGSFIVASRGSRPWTLYTDANPRRCNPSRYVVYGGNGVTMLASAGDMRLVAGPDFLYQGWVDEDALIPYPDIAFPTSPSEGASALAGIRLLTELLPRQMVRYSRDGLGLFAFRKPSVEPVLRRPSEEWMPAATQAARRMLESLVINASLFACDFDQDGTFDSCDLIKGTVITEGLPTDPRDWPPEGPTVQNGQVIAGLPYSGDPGNIPRRWLAIQGSGNDATWEIGFGDNAPTNVSLAFSGGRNPDIPSDESGVTMMGLIPEEDLVLVIVQQDAIAGVNRADIDNALTWLGVDDENKILWDSGSSATAVYRSVGTPDPVIVAQPPDGFDGKFKRLTLPVGMVLGLPGSACLPDSINCNPNQQ